MTRSAGPSIPLADYRVIRLSHGTLPRNFGRSLVDYSRMPRMSSLNLALHPNLQAAFAELHSTGLQTLQHLLTKNNVNK